MRFFCIVIAATALAVSVACNRLSSADSRKMNAADSMYTKEIHFPNTLAVLEDEQISSLSGFSQFNQGKKKLISIIDVTCASCILSELNPLDSLFWREFDHTSIEMIFVLNIPRRDSIYFSLNFRKNINARSLLVWDSNFDFERANNLFSPYRDLRTFMIDEKNRLIVFGNPLYDRNLLDEYKRRAGQR